MKTIKEHEKEFWKRYKKPEKESLSGVACPECGEELLVDNTKVLASYPPQREVKCPKCGYFGSIH